MHYTQHFGAAALLAGSAALSPATASTDNTGMAYLDVSHRGNSIVLDSKEITTPEQCTAFAKEGLDGQRLGAKSAVQCFTETAASTLHSCKNVLDNPQSDAAVADNYSVKCDISPM